MYRTREQDLPFVGSSYQFVGVDNGDVNVSVFLLRALPGAGPGPHKHPYDEVQFVREGRGLWMVDGKEFEAGGRHSRDQGRRSPRLQVHWRRSAGPG
jgi:quercetin dioxygenase-like cupin family protein